ncbi:cytochrome-c oxidase, cbb3-type subunit III [Roseovarius autotrophicus]|uniref:cytochrome-c oxidase, cbb3-type subunit III n=1 Tax=Roseovarius autotrophicus TaxID=2824121 RepID=UPI0019E66F5F|nr:cytochrome-c oxidase, cbb3-type subunit III [Roseovarius autotrophicus]MBE0452874.1 cytochrome-c oxidase, cbb3-type subunit III [Roseovarius sp.]
MAKKADNKKQVETTGHSWDGIEEYNNPLPRWWVWVFYATIAWGLWYVIAYPAWPLINQATAGYKGWSTRANVAAEIEAAREANAGINARLVAADLNDVPGDAELNNYAVAAGGAVFRTWCAQCHGSGAAGVQAGGYPNLLDNDWLWGGSLEDIHTTIAHGIRNETDPDARWSQMPAFGDMLDNREIDQVVNYVMALSGEPKDASAVAAGEEIYLDNCAACHGEAGEGDVTQGAPNLADAIWLYGGSYETITETVRYSRFGVMPSWADRLSEAEVRAVAVYVHQLGGGE